MAKSTIREQIKELAEAEKYFPEYSELIKLHMCILKKLLPIEDSLLFSNEKIIIDEEIIRLKKELQKNLRVIGISDVEIFKEERFRKAVEDIIGCLQKGNWTLGLDRLTKSLKMEEINVIDGFRATLERDSTWFKEVGDKYGIEASMLLYIFSAPLRPFFEELARALEGEFRERWLKPHCPICGRVPMVARVRERKRFMTCSYCGAEYAVDQFLCVHCGNNDPGSLGFIAFEGNPWFEIDHCEKCKHYVKVLFEDGIVKKIPKGLEDLLTQDLDSIAKKREFGLIRS